MTIFCGLLIGYCVIVVECSKGIATNEEKRELSDKERKVDKFLNGMHGICINERPGQTARQLKIDTQSILDKITLYKDLVKMNKQLRSELDWIVKESKSDKEISSLLELLNKDVRDICHPKSNAKVRDCTELKTYNKKSGVYNINPDKKGAFKTYCNMDVDGGGWTVIQRRVDGTTDFYRTWYEYKHGFGNLEKNFWLGNEKIHQLTSSGRHELRIDMKDWQGRSWYAVYKTFIIGDENSKYRITVDKYHGSAGDSLKYHNTMKFSTKDQDNDVDNRNCAQKSKGGWWYRNCHTSNLNAVYPKGKHSEWEDISWNINNQGKGYMKFSRMMIRKY